MFEPGGSRIAIALLAVNLCCWGIWPRLRDLCAVPMPAFALLNISSQLLASLFWAALLGSSDVGNDVSAFAEISKAFAAPNLQMMCVLAGGFLLGHGDHLGALAMQSIPAGIAYPIYGGLALVGGTLLNVWQTGLGKHPTFLVSGLLSCCAALAFLALAKELGPSEASSGTSVRDCTPGNSLNDQFLAKEPQRLSSHKALAITFLAGCCSSLWSPLSTFARTPVPGINEAIRVAYVTAFVFPLGQCCAYPSAALLGSRLGGVSIKESFQMLTFKRFFFGCLCGVVVNSGYVLYFLSSVPVSPTIAFCFAACNPLLCLVIDSLRCRFRNGGVKQWAALLTSGLLYSSAIALLALASE